MFKNYISYYLKAQTAYRVHSPWASELLRYVVDDRRHFYAFDKAELLRRRLLQSTESIEIQDLGAGSKHQKGAHRRIADLAKHAASSPRQGRWLFKLINWLQPQSLLELGTSLGLGTFYQASALGPKAQMHSIEGCPQIAQQAQQNLAYLPHLQLHQGAFESILPQLLPQLAPLDYVFLDGNHRYQASLDYFQTLLPYLSSQAVLVFDDLYWSEEMFRAWQTLKAHENVQISIDLLEFGILRLGKQGPKQDLTLCPWHWKPYLLY